jgi:hypothetical protein
VIWISRKLQYRISRYILHTFCGILGLIDEMFGIQQSSVRLPAEKFSQQQQQQQQQMPDIKQIVFSSSEEMYAEIRGLNFNAVGPTLSRKVCVPATSYFHQCYVCGSASIAR